MQEIYRIIDKKFELFVKNNQILFDKMEDNEIINITDSHRKVKDCTIYSVELLKEPFCIGYIGKLNRMESCLYTFLDKQMNKVYVYESTTK